MGIFYGELPHMKRTIKKKGSYWIERWVEEHNVLNNPEEWLKQILFPGRFINKHGCLYAINNT